MVGLRLRHAGRHRAHTDLGDEFYADPGLWVDVLQVMDELRQILDGIDVVVRRRRDQADARCGMAHLRDRLVDLVAGKLAALAGLGTLRSEEHTSELQSLMRISY